MDHIYFPFSFTVSSSLYLICYLTLSCLLLNNDFNNHLIINFAISSSIYIANGTLQGGGA